MATFSHEGQFIDIIPEADVAAGDFYAIGTLWGVAPYDIAAGQPGVIQTGGVFRAVLKNGDDVGPGDVLYAYGKAGVALSAPSSSGSGSGSGGVATPVGIALEAVDADGTATVLFKLNA